MRGGEIDQAKKVIKTSNNLAELARETGLKHQTLKNYRQGTNKIDKASWITVHELAQAYASQKIQADQQKFISDWFDHRYKRAAQKDKPVIKKVKQIILSDPLAVTELYKVKHNDIK